jgi:hypothetical protein
MWATNSINLPIIASLHFVPRSVTLSETIRIKDFSLLRRMVPSNEFTSA